VKSRSIDVIADPKLVVRNQILKLEASGFTTKQVIGLEPYDKDHAIIRGTYD
jgi:fibrillarin-like pre-rRNA processing protein